MMTQTLRFPSTSEAMADRENKMGTWKYKNLENKNSSLDEIKSIFQSF